MKSHIIGFLLVTLAQIPMPIKIGTTFQNKLRPNTYVVFAEQLRAEYPEYPGYRTRRGGGLVLVLGRAGRGSHGDIMQTLYFMSSTIQP